MNMMEGETFQMKIGNEDSDDEEVEESEVVSLDSSCSRISLRNIKEISVN